MMPREGAPFLEDWCNTWAKRALARSARFSMPSSVYAAGCVAQAWSVAETLRRRVRTAGEGQTAMAADVAFRKLPRWLPVSGRETPTPSPKRRGGERRAFSVLLPLSASGRGLGGGVSLPLTAFQGQAEEQRHNQQ